MQRRSPMTRENQIIDVLGDEILMLVLGKLPESADRKSWCLVCKHFFMLDSSCRKQMQLIRSELLPRILGRYSSIEYLDLSLCSQITDESLGHVADLLGERLLSINLSRICTFTHKGLNKLIQKCSSLVEIDLSNCFELTDEAAEIINSASQLQSLNLEKCKKITDIGIVCIAVGCTKLQTLNIRWCVGVTDDGVELLAKRCKQLQNLDVSYTLITNKCLVAMMNLNFLENLALVGCVNVTDFGVLHLKTSLQRLDISRSRNGSCTGLISLASCSSELRQLTLGYCTPITDELLTSFQNLDRLQTIKFDGCQLSSMALDLVGKSCKFLRDLSLSKCTGVTDSGLSTLVGCCSELNKLDLTCCRELTDAAISAIAKGCRYLSSLKIESCSLITEQSLASLGEGCPFLQELDLTNCNVVNQGLKYLSRCSELVSLKLGFCPEITDEGVAHIGARCSCLQELDFYRAVRVGDAGLAAVANGCPRLKSINISHCTNVTDNGMKSLSHLQKLHNLEIRGCYKISSVGLSAVALGCKRIVELDLKRCYTVDDVGILAIAEACQNLRQINISYCSISDIGLLALSNLKCLQDIKAVHTRNVTAVGYANALVCCKSLKKLKLLRSLKTNLAKWLIRKLEAQGCNVRWMDKPFVV